MQLDSGRQETPITLLALTAGLISFLSRVKDRSCFVLLPGPLSFPLCRWSLASGRGLTSRKATHMWLCCCIPSIYFYFLSWHVPLLLLPALLLVHYFIRSLTSTFWLVWFDLKTVVQYRGTYLPTLLSQEIPLYHTHSTTKWPSHYTHCAKPCELTSYRNRSDSWWTSLMIVYLQALLFEPFLTAFVEGFPMKSPIGWIWSSSGSSN